MVTGGALVLLGLFVRWGVRTSPHRPFSWGMYSGSSKGFLWTSGEGDGRRRPVCHHELGLAPEGHLLTLTELHRLLGTTAPQVRFEGLIIGSTGDWRIRYEGRLLAAPIPPGAGHARLVAALRELE
ncbi:hypothetical protein [Streptomyces rubellomurinus]|uniref:hypothetical protein n=1 Tax=Streptomyces rubellomurinus (strain ATCC 31215) TaxID=359131 RepID=UPI0012FE842A|nr:hypothetical protein [Streptomyces rubellomurinus]